MRCGRRPLSRSTNSSSRASVSARCEPRLSPATAWISSTITVCTRANSLRDFSAVSRMKSDSGVVTSTCGGLRSIRARSAWVVSPVRVAVRMGARGRPRSSAAVSSSPSGISRFLWTSLVSALSGETYTTRVSSGRSSAAARRIKSSRQCVKAASVFPEPVGAEMSTSLPARMSGQPWTCGSVGSP